MLRNYVDYLKRDGNYFLTQLHRHHVICSYRPHPRELGKVILDCFGVEMEIRLREWGSVQAFQVLLDDKLRMMPLTFRMKRWYLKRKYLKEGGTWGELWG